MTQPTSKKPADKRGAVPVRRTPKQAAAIAKAAEKKAVAEDLAERRTKADDAAARAAQIANLLIAGETMGSIAAATGMTETELEALLAADAAKFVRSQKSLRVWMRRYLSAQYTKMLDVDMGPATDPLHPDKLAHQDRARALLSDLAKLHGAAAPTQSEVIVEAAPEAIENMVAALAAQAGRGYDADIFDVPDEDVTEVVDTVSRMPGAALAALEQAADKTEADQVGDHDL